MKRLSVSLSVVGFFTGAALALAEPPAVEGALFVGGSFVAEDSALGDAYFRDQVPDASLLFGLRGGYRLHPRFAFELELDYAPTRTRGDRASGRPSIGAHVFGARAHARYTMFPHAALRPLLVAGGGASVVTADAPERYGLSVPDLDPVADYGVGVEYSIEPSLFGIRLDLRQTLSPGLDGVAVGYLALLGGTYDFSGAARAERQRLRRVRSVADDGDGDGIVDRFDRCPTAPELPNGIDDADGCPEVDTDGDGIFGSRDACPAAAEDADGYQDDDGCPDTDNDGDGVADVRDACPRERERENGFEDTDGCPDELPERVRKFTGTIEGIEFALGSATILPEFCPVLAE